MAATGIKSFVLTGVLHRPAQRRTVALIGTAGALLAAAILYLLNPLQQLGWLRCPVQLTTGFYCPGCGSLRAIHALLHGDLFGALDLNLLAVVALPILLGIGILAIFRGLQGDRFILRVSPRVSWSIFWIILLFTIARNLPFDLFRWLQP
jgi:hypothetical protein